MKIKTITITKFSEDNDNYNLRTEKKDRRLFTSLYGRGWGVDCDEVVTGLYIGDKAAISNTAFLKKQEITHVLNAAEGRDEGEWQDVN